ncbi:SDR family oxidoreductase [Kineosporia rhizophila]|uniref:SDR family oxidoreductase n=1 Tax=Kineosporia TaxID=49184 RepID=UPI001E3D045B|nr:MULTISPECIES: SDR family oxidoreductase [Kineosporia]MCE0533941.1 SDR family oxidoreductase [Kineosporia rhizophila]GLY13481.1 nucleoside-diphosphate sugar epimerase [Kineosporia sp. NBRC 101677]
MRIAVAGGTGTVGRHVADAVTERGHELVLLTRSAGVDLVSGEGLDLTGVDVVVDVTSKMTQKAAEAQAFFGAVTRNLLAAEQVAGVRHHLVLSIVGIDTSPSAYYTGKLLQEKLVQAGEVPWTILRATQFHEFATQILGVIGVGPLHLIPVMRNEPVAAREVAGHLLDLALKPAAGRVPDLGGPQEEKMVDMVRAYLKHTGRTGFVLPVPVPGASGKAMRNGTLVTGPGAVHGRQTYAQWLAEQPQG